MKKHFLLVLLALSFTVLGQSKMLFDVNLNTEQQDGLFKYGPSREGKMIKGENLEYSILSGGYFSLGTSAEYSDIVLENNCQLTFGHPYSLTSYIKIFNNEKWYYPFEDFEILDYNIETINDTLKLTFIDPSNYEVTFVISENDSSKSVQLSVAVKNLSTNDEKFNVGIILDPALGKWGDGYLFFNDVPISSEILIENLSVEDELKILERKHTPFGIGHKLNFDKNLIKQIHVANWREFENENFSEDELNGLYDLTLEMVSKDTLLASDEIFDFEVEVELLNSIFSDLFIRANIPSEFSIEQNFLFPQNIDMHFELFNSSQYLLDDLKLTAEVPYFSQSTQTQSNFIIQSESVTYNKLSIPVIDLYENVVVPINIQCFNNDQVVDSFQRNIFIPAVPRSDTGLVISIDSLIENYPELGLRFNVTNEESGAFIFNLKNHNIFLYQNDERVEEFNFMKDTSNGITDIDIAFVLDVTGSMGNEIEKVKTNIVEFADSLEERGYNYNLALVTFLDEIENVYDFTSNVLEFKSWVENQYAHGGGDYPENSLDALLEATKLSFRQSSNRVVIWITDASYHMDDNVSTSFPNEVVNALLSEGITTHCIGNPSEQVNFYEPITIPTGGDYYDIYGNFRDILLDIARFQYLTDYLILFNSNMELAEINSLKLEVHYAGLGGSDEFILGTQENKIKKFSTSCYPNPFNPVTTISISKPTSANGIIEIFNILGQRVKSITMPIGTNQFQYQWNGRSDDMQKLSSGIYLLNSRIFENGKLLNNNTIKLMLLK